MRVKRKTKRILGVIATVLVAVALSAFIGNISGGFQNGIADWQWREVNEENLYQTMDFADTDGLIANGEKGVTVELAKDNVLKVDGNATEALSIELGTVTLKAGTAYVVNSSLKESSRSTMYISIVKADGTVIVDSFTKTVTIPATAIEEDTQVKLMLHIAAEYEVNNISIRPVLCIGENADALVSFYK